MSWSASIAPQNITNQDITSIAPHYFGVDDFYNNIRLTNLGGKLVADIDHSFFFLRKSFHSVFKQA